MNTHTQSTPENVKARLTLDVTCLLNGEAASEILARLQRMWVRAIGERLLIDETAAKVDVWSIEVTELPSAPNSDALESEIAAFMQQRIEDGKIDLGQYAVEQLALALDPFPRKPGATFVQPEEPAEISPFAALKALKPRDGEGRG